MKGIARRDINEARKTDKSGETSSGIGLKFSFVYPRDGGINALLFPENNMTEFG